MDPPAGHPVAPPALPGDLATPGAQVKALQMANAQGVRPPRNVEAPIGTTLRDGHRPGRPGALERRRRGGSRSDSTRSPAPPSRRSASPPTGRPTRAWGAGRLDVSDPGVPACLDLTGDEQLAAKPPSPRAVTFDPAVSADLGQLLAFASIFATDQITRWRLGRGSGEEQGDGRVLEEAGHARPSGCRGTVDEAVVERQRQPHDLAHAHLPSTTHGFATARPIARMADSPGLMIGVPPSTPKTPTLVMVIVPLLASAGCVCLPSPSRRDRADRARARRGRGRRRPSRSGTRDLAGVAAAMPRFT